jgi:hypothetical protein
MDLDAIMLKALAIDPDARFQTAGELNEALTRCAHRNGLLMSAPELAQELLAACGDIDQWRGDDDDDDLGYVQRAGTEVYDPGEDEDEDDEDSLGAGPMSIHSIAAKMTGPSRSGTDARPSRPKTEVGKFQGVELTSIINMIDLESRVAADGARPLVDLDVGPKLDSGPRMIDTPRTIEGIGPGGPGSRPQLPPPKAVLNPEDMVTAPRRMPQLAAAPPMAQQPQYPVARPQNAPPGYARPLPRAPSVPRPARATWLVILVILILAGVVALVVAMSGPDVSSVKDEDRRQNTGSSAGSG